MSKKHSATNTVYRIASKRFHREIKQYLFTIETGEIQFERTADELAGNQDILANLPFHDVYDVGYTHGSEAILKEQKALLAAKKKIY
ncbi:MAG: hypothetical protein EPO11_01085 [Gammaproteobacteria bacterium]|nr:MAG: hypothetical protein EPO11_01085 [Gammaproteobacteria bacterium]